jgi:hypothetical protein
MECGSDHTSSIWALPITVLASLIGKLEQLLLLTRMSLLMQPLRGKMMAAKKELSRMIN